MTSPTLPPTLRRYLLGSGTQDIPLTLSAGVINDAVRAAGLQGDPAAPAGSTGLFPAATNLCLQSHTFNTSPWTLGTCTITENATASPNGALTASLISTPGLQAIQQTITVLASTVYTWSWYGKLGTKTTPHYRIRDLSNAANIVSDTATPGLSTSAYSRTIVTFTTPVGCTSLQISPLNGDADSGTFMLWGSQVELGAVATPVIQTTSASASRGAGRAQVATNQTGATMQQGTAGVLLRMGFASTVTNFQATALEIRNGAAALMVQIRNGTNKRWDITIGATGTYQTGDLAWAVGDYVLFIIKWSALGGAGGFSYDGGAFNATSAGVITDFAALADFGNNNGAPTTRAIASDLIWGFIGSSGFMTDADSARLKTAFGASASPRPTLRQLIQLIPTTHPTFLWDGRAGIAQRRVAA